MSVQNKPFVSVQPDNRTLVEEGLEYGWYQLINSLDCPYPDLKQPLLSPDDFISLLAAERGVLDWQPGDTVSQRREITHNAFDIHRRAGTRKGLEHALNALEVGAVVDRGSKPYAIKVSAEVPDGALTEDLFDRLMQRVTSYKSERDSVELETVRGSTSPAFIGVICETGVVSDAAPYTFDSIESTTSKYLGVLVETYVISDSEAAIQ